MREYSQTAREIAGDSALTDVLYFLQVIVVCTKIWEVLSTLVKSKHHEYIAEEELGAPLTLSRVFF